MYLDYYGFQEEPFNITPDSRFLFLSERHREALAALLYGIEQRKGFIALTGEIGCGKTTICRALLGRLDRETTRLALVFNPELSDLELLQTINAEFGLPASSASKRELLDQLYKFLLHEFENDRNVVLLIDEAQRLSPDALEQVRLISNLETESAKLIQIALVGQPELADILDLPELEQLNQRITVRYHIEPLTVEEVNEYIEHRLAVAQPKLPVRFQKKAVRKVFEFSRGVPRRVNVVCDRALLVTFVREETEVTEANVVKAIEEVGGMPKRHARVRAAATASPISNHASAEPTATAASAPPAHSGVWVIAIALLMGFALMALALWDGKAGHVVQPREVPPPEGSDTALASIGPLVPGGALPRPEEPPSPTPREAIEVAAASPMQTPASTPSPSPTATPQPTPTASPEQTAMPSETPAAALVVAQDLPTTETIELNLPEPTPEPSPTEQPSSLFASVIATSTPAAPPTAEAEKFADWNYDSSGIVRVDDRAKSYPAAVLTWLALQRGERLPDSELAQLRAMNREQISALQLTGGRPPLHLREARLPANIRVLENDTLPVLVQVDEDAGFGPWAVLIWVDQNSARLNDPVLGRIEKSADELRDHLAAVVAPFLDPDMLTGLARGDVGERVKALQKRLMITGHYRGELHGNFNQETEEALVAYREAVLIPGQPIVDEAIAFRLRRDSESSR